MQVAVQVVEAAARRALEAERAHKQALQVSRQFTPQPSMDGAAPSTSGTLPWCTAFMAKYAHNNPNVMQAQGSNHHWFCFVSVVAGDMHKQPACSTKKQT